VAPLTIPGRPPKRDVIKPIIKAAFKPTRGLTVAIRENAIASGTYAKATVIPERTS